MNNMIKLISLGCFILSLNLFSAEVLNVEIRPKNPTVNEIFQLIFTIETSKSEEPAISFEPGSLEVQQKQNLGLRMSTSIINGRLSTKRELSYAYDLVASREGTYSIRDINVEIDGSSLTHKPITFKVFKTPPKKKDFFLQAEVAKDEIYVGEGLFVSYYFYSRVGSAEYEILSFPKLGKFLKSFAGTPTDANNRVETVDVDGVVYRRKMVYKCKLFAEREGNLNIDSMRLRVTYVDGNRGLDPFGGFGFGTRRVRKKTIQSKNIKIKAKPLPGEGVPAHFTGLVGKHIFDLQVPKEKYLVNEAIEVKFKVTGPGALENYDGPKVYSHVNLEEFDTNSEISVNEQGPSQKRFEYTFLARGPLKQSKGELPLAYFDPDSRSYVTVKLPLPRLEVFGSSGSTIPKKNEPTQKTQNSPLSDPGDSSNSFEDNSKTIGSGLVGPYFAFSKKYFNYIFLANLLLIALIIVIYVPGKLGLIKGISSSGQGEKLLREIQKDGLSYGRVFRLAEELRKVLNSPVEQSAKEMFLDSPLSKEAQKYFIKILNDAESLSYEEDTKVNSFKVEGRYFKELKRVFKNAKI